MFRISNENALAPEKPIPLNRKSMSPALAIVFQVCCALLAACAATQKTPTPRTEEISNIYRAAVRDAMNPEPSEIYEGLVQTDNPTLCDTLINGQRHILVVTWTDERARAYYPDSGPYRTPEDSKSRQIRIWVTVAPEVRNRCVAYFRQQADPVMRLRQLLGLQPTSAKTIFVAFWVKPADLFRPCPDNETDDARCELTLPDATEPGYRKWFNELRAKSYIDCANPAFGNAGYPWTQLGYTYDWHPENETHIGVSEFIIWPGREVFVKRKYGTEDYCSENTGRCDEENE